MIGRHLLLPLLLAGSMASAPAVADSWQWSLTPYAWIISPGLDTGVSIPPDGGELRFSDLVDNLDFAASKPSIIFKSSPLHRTPQGIYD